jgi:hypothetical protein
MTETGVALLDDEDPIEEFAADAAHESLGDGVRQWRRRRPSAGGPQARSRSRAQRQDLVSYALLAVGCLGGVPGSQRSASGPSFLAAGVLTAVRPPVTVMPLACTPLVIAGLSGVAADRRRAQPIWLCPRQLRRPSQ